MVLVVYDGYHGADEVDGKTGLTGVLELATELALELLDG
jgi:hypothetical protein